MSAIGTIRFKAQGGMKANPDMKPWIIPNVINTYRGFVIRSQFTILCSHQIVLSVG